MPSEEGLKTVKLVEEITVLKKKNHMYLKQCNSQRKLIGSLQRELADSMRQVELLSNVGEMTKIMNAQSNTIAELQEELRKCETSRKQLKIELEDAKIPSNIKKLIGDAALAVEQIPADELEKSAFEKNSSIKSGHTGVQG